MAIEHLTQKELAIRIGLNTRQIRRLVDDGMPRERLGSGHATFPWPEALHWYIEYREQIAVDRVRPTDREASRDRKEAAEARMAELKVLEFERHLVPMDVLRETVADLCDRIRAKLVRLPGAWSPQLVGLDTDRQVVKVLREAVGEAVMELGRIDFGVRDHDQEEESDPDEEDPDDG